VQIYNVHKVTRRVDVGSVCVDNRYSPSPTVLVSSSVVIKEKLV